MTAVWKFRGLTFFKKRDRHRSSPYYSESELCGGAVTVSFSKKLSPRTFQTAVVFTPPS
jgi:hypothetical protein